MLDGPRFESGRRKILFSSPKRSDQLSVPPSLLLNGYRGYCPAMKRPGAAFDQSPPSAAEVKKEYSIFLLRVHDFMGWTGIISVSQNMCGSLGLSQTIRIRHTRPMRCGDHK
jgi:hypothetical protein